MCPPVPPQRRTTGLGAVFFMPRLYWKDPRCRADGIPTGTIAELLQGVVSKKVGIGFSGDFEFGKFRQDGTDGNSGFEGKRFGIRSAVSREDGAQGGCGPGCGMSGTLGMGVRNGRRRNGSTAGELAQDVVGHGYALGGTVADERIGSHASGTRDVSRHGEHLLSEFEGELGGNEAS